MAVSAALIGFGLVVAGRLRSGAGVGIARSELGLLVLGGVVVIASFVLNAGVVLAGGTPSEFPWPVFAAGMAIGIAVTVRALRSPGTAIASAS
jgi:hypothetical protein